jgi:hypothetical protein
MEVYGMDRIVLDEVTIGDAFKRGMRRGLLASGIMAR